MQVAQFILSAKVGGVRRYVFSVVKVTDKIKMPKYTDDIAKALKFDSRHIAGAFRGKLKPSKTLLEVEEYREPSHSQKC